MVVAVGEEGVASFAVRCGSGDGESALLSVGSNVHRVECDFELLVRD